MKQKKNKEYYYFEYKKTDQPVIKVPFDRLEKRTSPLTLHHSVMYIRNVIQNDTPYDVKVSISSDMKNGVVYIPQKRLEINILDDMEYSTTRLEGFDYNIIKIKYDTFKIAPAYFTKIFMRMMEELSDYVYIPPASRF